MLPVSVYTIQRDRSDFAFVGKIRVQILVASTVVLTALIFAQLVFASSLATDGEKLHHTNEQIYKLEAQNTTLKAEIAQLSSLTNLNEKAQKQGFKKPESIITP